MTPKGTSTQKPCGCQTGMILVKGTLTCSRAKLRSISAVERRPTSCALLGGPPRSSNTCRRCRLAKRNPDGPETGQPQMDGSGFAAVQPNISRLLLDVRARWEKAQHWPWPTSPGSFGPRPPSAPPAGR